MLCISCLVASIDYTSSSMWWWCGTKLSHCLLCAYFCMCPCAFHFTSPPSDEQNKQLATFVRLDAQKIEWQMERRKMDWRRGGARVKVKKDSHCAQ